MAKEASARKGPATIQMVADRAQVSPKTVSRVINNEHGVREETRDRQAELDRIRSEQAVYEDRVEEFVDAEIETRQNAIAQRLGYKIAEHSLVLYGRCQRHDCPARKEGRVKLMTPAVS